MMSAGSRSIYLSSVAVLLLCGAPGIDAAVAGSAARTAQAGSKATKAEAAEPSQSFPVVEIPHARFVLPNGLTVLVIEDHRTPTVAVQVWHHVGSANETPGRTGFAHLFEHLVFNGSEHMNTDWFKPLNEIGATGMNGTTSLDRTNYFQTVPTAGLDRTLWLEADRMGHLLPAVDQAKLDEQRGVVQNEKRQRSNTPTGDVPERIAKMTYPEGHPYSWQTIGSMEDLNAASLTDVAEFYNKWYGAANTVLVLAGDITLEQAKAKAEHFFGWIPSGPPLNRAKQWPAKMIGEKRDVMDLRTSNASVLMVWNAPGWADKDARLLSLAAEALGGSQDSPLTKRLIRDEKLASDARVSIEISELGSQFVIDVTVRPGVDPAKIEAVINEELATLLSRGPSVEDLNRIKFDRYASLVKSTEATDRRGQILAENELYAGSADFYRTSQQWNQSATPESIAAAARRWLSDGRYVLNARPVPDYKVAANDPTLGQIPPIGKPASFQLPALKSATLSNGMKVELAEFHQTPTVSFSLMFDAGIAPDRTASAPGLGAIAVRETLNGTKTRSALDIGKLQRDLGTRISWSTGLEMTRVSMTALKLRVDQSLALLSDVLMNPIFPESEWKRVRDNGIDDIREQLKAPAGKTYYSLPKIMYGAEHPYAAKATPESLMKLTTADFKEFYSRWIRPDNATLLIVGDTTLADIIPQLENSLGRWRAPQQPLPVKPPLPAPQKIKGPRVVLVDQPGATSTIIQVVQGGPVRSDPDFDTKDLFAQILGGNFLSRLNMNLREEKHWSYGATAKIGEQALVGQFAAGSAVQVDKTAAAMKEIDRELRDVIGRRPPTAAEVAMARNSMLLGLPAQLGTNSNTMTLYAQQNEFGLTDDYWNNYSSNVSAITPERVSAAAKSLIKPSEWAWFVVGDLSKIEADIRALNLGPVEVVDAMGNPIR